MPLSKVFTTEDELLLFALFTATLFADLVFVAANALFASTIATLDIKRSRESARPTGVATGEDELFTMASMAEVKWEIPAVKLGAT
jgi:hypothetical protein